MADQETYDYVAHYDPVAAEIVEPISNLDLDTLNVREITCFKIRLDEIEDADADIDNGITVDGDLFLADTSTVQLATVQGVDGAEIDFLDDIAFDTGSGIKFGLGAKLSEYETGSLNLVFKGATTLDTMTCTVYYVKIGKLVTLTFLRTGNLIPIAAADYMLSTTALPADLRPPLALILGGDQVLPIQVVSNAAETTGFVNVSSGIVEIRVIGGFSAGLGGFDGFSWTFCSE